MYKPVITFAFSFAVVFILTTVNCGIDCYDAWYPNYTKYGFKETTKTKLGIRVEDPNNELDLDRLDAITLDVIDCLKGIKELTLAEQVDAECLRGYHFESDIKSCFSVKVPEWHYSPCTPGEQLFQCSVGDGPCLFKGLTPTKECPCLCRAMIEDNAMVLTTPNLKLYPAYLVTLLTGCNLPWTPTLSKCANPR